MMKDLNELYRKVTSVNIDVEDMIEKSTNKEATFRHLIWSIPNGSKWKNDPEVNTLIDILSNKCLITNADDICNETEKLLEDNISLSTAEIELSVKGEEIIEE